MRFKDIYLAGIILVSGIAATLGGVYAYDYLFYAGTRRSPAETFSQVRESPRPTSKAVKNILKTAEGFQKSYSTLLGRMREEFPIFIQEWSRNLKEGLSEFFDRETRQLSEINARAKK